MAVAATLRDVARRAGVSPRTVSNVVNDFHYVSPGTRARVQAALDELGYRPNLLARSLRQGRTGIIALLVPNLTAPYFAELAHAIVESASQRGCTVMIDETGGDARRERELLDIAAHSSWLDGILLSSLGMHGPQLTRLTHPAPIVLLGERTAASVFDHVGIDNVRAARDAVKHLQEGGRRRIAAIGGHSGPDDPTSTLRLTGYRQQARSAGLSVKGLYAPTVDYRPQSAEAALERLLSIPHPPDALFCFSDDLAIGVLRGLYRRGVRVPDDIAVVGFDDIQHAALTAPSLTSVGADKQVLAERAITLLLERINSSHAPPRDSVVSHHLQPRESTGGDLGICSPKARPGATT